MRLAGKVALVTGAQQGIGEAIALSFGREGAAVVVNYLDDAAAAESIATQITAQGSKAITVAGDVSRAADVNRMLEAADSLGPIQILVNNAGIFPRMSIFDLTEEVWDRVLGVNLKGSFLCAQGAARRMVQTASPGVIINISSLVAFRGSTEGAAHYVASKGGVLGLTRALALELAPHGIRVNGIAPGLTDTAQPRDGMTEEQIQAAAATNPLGRIATPQDIADLAVFLASEESAHITGQMINVNGGTYLH